MSTYVFCISGKDAVRLMTGKCRVARLKTEAIPRLTLTNKITCQVLQKCEEKQINTGILESSNVTLHRWQGIPVQTESKRPGKDT